MAIQTQWVTAAFGFEGQVMQGITEVLAYGTAVVIEPER